MLATLLTLATLALNQNVEINGVKSAPQLSEMVVVTVTEFDDEHSAKFADDMERAWSTGQSFVPIVIDSYGGSVYALTRMLDVIASSPVPIATIVTGKAMSCGAVLFAAGSEGMRYAGPNSTILIHDVSSMVRGKVEDLKIEASEAERLDNLLFAVFDRATHHPSGYFRKLLKSMGSIDWYITPQEAKDLGLVSEIKLPTLKTSVTIHQSIE